MASSLLNFWSIPVVLWEILSSNLKLQSAQPLPRLFAWKLPRNLDWVQEVVKQVQGKKNPGKTVKRCAALG